MLKAEVRTSGGGGSNTTIAASGTLVELVAEVGCVIAGVHSHLMRNNPNAARLFRRELINLLTDPETPAWEGASNAKGIMITIPKTKEEE